MARFSCLFRAFFFIFNINFNSYICSVNVLQDISPEGLIKIMEEHERCKDPVYFFQRFVIGKPIKPDTRDIIRDWQKMERILNELKQKGRI